MYSSTSCPPLEGSPLTPHLAPLAPFQAPFRIARQPPLYPLSFEKFHLIKELYRHKFIRSSDPKHQDTCVLIDNVGSFNESLKAFRRHGITDDDIIEHAVFLIAYFTSIIDARSYPHGRIVRVFDLSGFRLSHATNLRAMRLGMRLTKTAERYFPEVLQEVIVLNAHPFAIGMYNSLIRGLLHERTRNKFQFHTDDKILHEILGTEQADWQNAGSAVEIAMYDYVRRETECK